MKAAPIEFRRVTKRYGDVTAVADISLGIAAGSLVTLLGPSGCGKTTMLRLIAGLELPTSGAIFIGERNVSRVPAAERDVSMVFQSYALFPHMSVLENVRYGLVVAKVPRAQANERARAALAQVGLDGYDGRLPSELSGGQQQRVAVARARSCSSRWCCCSTSRCRTSTRACAGRCARRSANCSGDWDSPSCTSRTTRRKRWRYPIESSS
jgi:iron(III) transport system ATP-binding protein